MKEHFQDSGVRKWAGDDLIELQSESLEALQGLVEPYAPCIIKGCEVETVPGADGAEPTYKVSGGLVALRGVDAAGNGCVKIARVEGFTSEVMPVYLSLSNKQTVRAYGDGSSKVIANDYIAECSSIASEGALELTDAGGKRLVDMLGVTQKLDRVGGDASATTVRFSRLARMPLMTGWSLKLLFGTISKWLYDLRALAFKDKVAKGDLTDELAGELDGKVEKVAGKDLSDNNFTNALKDRVSNSAQCDSDNMLMSRGDEFNFSNETCGAVFINYRRGNGAIKGGIQVYHMMSACGNWANRDDYAQVMARDFVVRNVGGVYHPANKPTPGDIGAANEIHLHCMLGGIPDTRSVVETPNDYNGGFFAKGIKYASAYGISGVGNGYLQVFGYRGWTDGSGGHAHEFALADDGTIYHRHGDAKEWSVGWEKIAHISDLKWDNISGKPSLEPKDLRVPGLQACGLMSSSGGVSFQVGSAASAGRSSKGTYYFNSIYGPLAGVLLVTPQSEAARPVIKKEGGNATVFLYDSNGNLVDASFRFMYLAYGTLQ